MLDQDRDQRRAAARRPETTAQRIRLLEEALAEYVERYGLTDRAREALAVKPEG